MEGHVAPYLKEVGLAGNPPGQLQGIYVWYCVFTCIRTRRHMSNARAYLDS